MGRPSTPTFRIAPSDAAEDDEDAEDDAAEDDEEGNAEV
jgi:hypothetical protein